MSSKLAALPAKMETISGCMVRKRPASNNAAARSMKKKPTSATKSVLQPEVSTSFTVTTMSGTSLPLCAKPYELVRDVKLRIIHALRLPAEHTIALTCGTELMGDEQRVSDLPSANLQATVIKKVVSSRCDSSSEESSQLAYSSSFAAALTNPLA